MIGATMAAVGIVGTLSPTLVDLEDAAILLVFGLLGYLFAVRTRRSIGTTPWRLPAITWAIVSALLPLWGLMLEMVARYTTRQAAPGSRSPLAGLTGGGLLGRRREPRDTTHAPPAGPLGLGNPAGGNAPWPTEVTLRPGPGGWRPTAPAPGEAPAPPPLFGWYPDPDVPQCERYWDGRKWADLVRENGAITTAVLGEWRAPWEAPAREAVSVPAPVSTDA
ncbi:MAG: DUF2510 domain-containing protein [Acidimicrobiales bacterium]